jgi:hypothetical protein
MKRRRPWASPSTIVAATVLLTAQLWTHKASGVPIFFENYVMLKEGDLPIELDVETPSAYPTVSPVPTMAPQPSTASDGVSPSLVKQSLDLSYDVVLNVTRSVDMADLLGSVKTVMEEYLFRSLRLLEEDNDFRIRKVTLAVSLVVRRTLLRQRYLQTRQSQDITIEVDGSVQYDLQGGGDFSPERVEFLLEEELAGLLTEDNLRLALQDSEVEGVLDVDEATIVDDRDEGNAGNDDDTDEANTAEGDDDGNETIDGTERSRNGLFGGKKQGELERPSTLSIAFGFALTGIAFLGLIAYAYIFYRKRQKRLRRKKQMKDSIQYRLPAPKVSPAKRSAPNTPQQQQKQPQQQQVATMKVVTPSADDDSSDGSSYKGLDSVSDDGPADSFAKELQMAASLDEQAWEDFQRKKDALNRNEVIRATEVGSIFGQQDSGVATTPKSPASTKEGGGKTWAKSFPYGDEQEVVEEGIEWTADGGANDWNSYNNSSPRGTTKAEEKKDEWENDQEQPPASVSTAAILESIQRDLAVHGTNIDPEPTREDMTASDVVLEVERLSRYVKRYEKRKERRAKREHERSFRSSDASSSAQNLSISSPTHSAKQATSRSIRKTSVSPQGIAPRSREPIISRSIREDSVSPKGYTPRSEDFSGLENYRGGYSVSQKENVQRQEQAPRITTFTGTFDNSRSAPSPHNPDLASIGDYPDEVSEDTFDYTFQDQEQEGSLPSQRLGITPFNSEKKEEPSFNYEAMSPMMQKLAKAEALRSSREDHSLPTDEPIMERRLRTQSDGEAHANRGGGRLSGIRGNHLMLDARRTRRLSDLRDNTAIIDSSHSDVNVPVGFFQPPYEGVEIPLPRATSEEPKTPTTTPKQKKFNSGPSPSRKFNKLRNLFEERQNEAIFPPDQHWQYGVAK